MPMTDGCAARLRKSPPRSAQQLASMSARAAAEALKAQLHLLSGHPRRAVQASRRASSLLARVERIIAAQLDLHS